MIPYSSNDSWHLHSLKNTRIGYPEIILTVIIVFSLSIFTKYRRGIQSLHRSVLRTSRHSEVICPVFESHSLPWVFQAFFYLRRGGTLGYTPRGFGDIHFTRFRHDTLSFFPFVIGTPIIYTSNIDVARQVVWPGSKGRSFQKPFFTTRGLGDLGVNVVSADGDQWRRHRRILAPAFNKELYSYVWSESLKTYREMVDSEQFTSKPEIELMEVQAITGKFALTIIGRCGFGLPFNWNDEMRAPDGKTTIQQTLYTVCDTFVYSSTMPRWLRNLIPIKKMRESVDAHDQALSFLTPLVLEKKKLVRGQYGDSTSTIGKDIFTLLVEANEAEGAKLKLDDGELMSNVYGMLIAGYETTANTLTATLGFLSIQQDFQQEIYNEIVEVVGLDREPVLDDIKALEKIRCAFLEAMRMFPAVYILIREAYEDTTLQIPPPQGSIEEDTIIPVPKGTLVVVDMIGVQYNTRYFEKPDEYIPSRWKGTSIDSESVTAFSAGPRVCIGRKFAMTEAICFLTMFLRDFRIEPIMLARETKKEWLDRVMNAQTFITLGVKSIPIKLVRRTTA